MDEQTKARLLARMRSDEGLIGNSRNSDRTKALVDRLDAEKNRAAEQRNEDRYALRSLNAVLVDARRTDAQLPDRDALLKATQLIAKSRGFAETWRSGTSREATVFGPPDPNRKIHNKPAEKLIRASESDTIQMEHKRKRPGGRGR